MGESSDSSVAAMETVEEVQNQPKTPPKQINLLEIMEKWEEDRLTALPDCLLLQILCRLPSTKDAIRTGTLSKRWKDLWTLVPTLIFNHYDDILPWSDFVSFIDKTLNQCRQLKLKKFELYTSSYDIGSDSQVNNWIRYAIRCSVEELILTLWNMESEDELLVDQSFFINSCFTDLKLSGCILNPTGAISWKNLRRLCISDRCLHEKLIEKILSGSPVLETLALHDCYGYRRLDITSKSVKNLMLSGYDDDDDDDDDADLIESIEINAPNILSLTIQGNLVLWKVLLVNVSSLVEANLDYERRGHWEARRKEAEEEMLKGFILNLCHVKELKIGDLCSKVFSRLEAKGFDFPSNVKFLGVAEDTDSGESDWSNSDQSDSDLVESLSCDDDSVEGDWSESDPVENSEGFGFPSNMKFLGVADDDDSGESDWYDSDSVKSSED